MLIQWPTFAVFLCVSISLLAVKIAEFTLYASRGPGMVARLGVDMPQAQLDFYNRGISGHKVADLRQRWQKDAIEMKPDLLSILVGINDVGRNLGGVDIETWEADYRFILDASRQANPDLRLVLLDPFVLASGRLSHEDVYSQWRSQVERLIPIVARLAVDYKAVHVKTQEVFDNSAIQVSGIRL